METKNRVPFWLDVRKEYVRDNFVRMVEYLKWCQHNKDEIGKIDDPHTEYNRTVAVLREMAHGIADDLSERNIYDFEDRQWSDVSEDVRLLTTYLLAALVKGETDHCVILSVIELMLLTSRNITEDALCNLRDVTLSCMRREKVSFYGLSWDDILQWNDRSVDMLRINFSQTRFVPVTGRFLCSGRGTLLLDGGTLVMKMLNGDRCFTTDRLLSIDSLRCGIAIDVDKKSVSGKMDDFGSVRELCGDLQELQKGLKPLARNIRKPYQENDALVARVVFRQGDLIRAVSIDSRHETVESNIFVPPYLCGIKGSIVASDIKMGDHILVNYSENKADHFVLGDAFIEFDREFIQNAEKETIGVFLDGYHGGHRWLTADGVVVNVMGTVLPEHIQSAVDEQYPVCMDITTTIMDKSGNTIVNAAYSDEPCEDWSYDEVVNNAVNELTKGFLEWTKSRMPETVISEGYEEISRDSVRTLSRIVYCWSRCCAGTIQRYLHLSLSALLASMVEDGNDSLYIQEVMRYQCQLVRFAQATRGSELRFEPDSRLASLGSMQWRKGVISCLSDYKERVTMERNCQINLRSDDETMDMVRNLVNASNTLAGRIAQAELDRIKKTITRHLGVDDEFVNETDEVTYYGEESDKMEFKTSVVYPPEHGGKAIPAVQIWNILKTVCGMMNTVSGGEILVGVMDNGYSCGVQSDIDYLYDSHMIAEPTMDKYRLYVKGWVDRTMADEMDIVSGVALTTDRIHYFIERNKEQHDILRIQVMPFEYGIVVFNSEIQRPQQVFPCYLRGSGATMPMNAEMRNQMRERKLHSSGNDRINKLIILQKACKEHRQVRLIGYSSKSSKRDRVVEPYMLIAEHDAYLCYDTSVQKNPLREFKLSRMSGIEPLPTTWKNVNKHRQLMVDLFGMLENVNSVPFEVTLKLMPLAYNLLKEECARADQFISQNTDSDSADYPYILRTRICSIEGVGRFYIGLAASIKIVDGDTLRQYAQDYVRNNIL